MSMHASSRFPRRFPAVAAAAFVLAACTPVVHTPYQRPAVHLPEAYPHAPDAAGAAAMPGGAWWNAYGDPNLDRLMRQALAQNNDLAAAAIAVRTARLQAHLAGNALWPEASSGVQTTDSKQLRHGSGFSRSSSASLGIGYEIDLWGKLRNYSDKARWEAMATEQDRQSTALSLTGTVADLYWETLYDRQRVALAQQSVAYAQKTLAIAEVQYQAGGTSRLDVLEARQNVASDQAALQDLLQAQVENGNALAVLFDGHAPELGALPARLPDDASPVVDPGLPASLLGRRPDLRAAEMRLREALVGVDYTRASYYPSLSLTGAVGGSSEALRNVLKTPIASLAAALDLPFLDWRDMHDNIAISKSGYAKDVVDFRQTLLQALADVDNALSARQVYLQKARVLQQALADAHAAEALAEIQYKAGAIPMQTWLDDQETRRAAEVALAENQLNQLETYATLCLALGGEVPAEPMTSAEVSRAGK